MARNTKPQTIRITGGRLKGRRLATPPGLDVRPTSERAREALFNRLAHGSFGPDGGPILPGARVADLYCGTGALGLEALSRGAACATFVDQSLGSLDIARTNATSLQTADSCVFLQATLPAGLPKGPFDLVFLDPPYAVHLAQATLDAVVSAGVLASSAIVCVETGKDTLMETPAALTLLDRRQYGAAAIWLFRAD